MFFFIFASGTPTSSVLEGLYAMNAIDQGKRKAERKLWEAESRRTLGDLKFFPTNTYDALEFYYNHATFTSRP